MTSSATYQFNPAAGNLVMAAFDRIQLRRSALETEHWATADNEANLLQVEISNKQPNLWRSELYTVDLEDGTATYTLNARLIAVQQAYLSTTTDDVTTDTVIWPLSAMQYASQPNKTTPGVPTSYWWNRQITPTVTMWPVPNADDTYTLNLRVLSQIQDVNVRGGLTLDMPYRFLDVFVAGLAYRLARVYKPELEATRKIDYAEAWLNAAGQDVDDNVGMVISPEVQGYWR